MNILRTAACLLALVAVSPGAEVWSGVDRIVAIGDVHGDYQQFIQLLEDADLVNDQLQWIGGQTHLVQTGDVPDRGPDTRKILDLLMDLEKQAKKAGGYVHALIGNHEAMNIYGDLRYVIPEEFASFATPKSPQLLQREFRNHVATLDPQPADIEVYRAQWDQQHPPGYMEHRAQFSPTGKYGRWIAKHNIVIKINDSVFLHGGIGPKYATFAIKDLNRLALAELRDRSKIEGGIVIDPEGPLWYRGLALHPESSEKAHLETALANLDAKRFVIGHSVSAGTVFPRFGGRVLMIDVGMSKYYGSRRACLLIEKGVAFAIHRGKKIEIPTQGGLALLPYLEKAAMLDPEPSPLTTTINQLEAAKKRQPR